MEVQEAIDLVNRITFRPTYKLTAQPGGVDGAHFIVISLRAMLHDTDQSNAPTYSRTFLGGLDHVLDVRKLTPDELLDRIFEWLSMHDVHEDREWFKVANSDGTYDAPFHPHTLDGAKRYHQLYKRGKVGTSL